MNIDTVAEALGVGPVAPVAAVDWEDTLVSAVDEVCWMLGSGLTENIYQNALAAELRVRGHVVEVERVFEVQYKNAFVGFLRADLVVDQRAVLEIKSVAKITDAHMAQLHAAYRAAAKHEEFHFHWEFEDLTPGTVLYCNRKGFRVRVIFVRSSFLATSSC